jgi:shikimate dehydrogenase
VVLLGSGGAARAIAFALAADTGVAHLTLLGIDEHERRQLAADLRTKTSLSVSEGLIDEMTLRKTLPEAQVLIHCTPVGMSPKMGESCAPASLLHPGLSVMDIVYNPRETKLLREAKAAGCRTVQGLEMFLHQAVAQFELWTGRQAPTDVMRQVLESHFS